MVDTLQPPSICFCSTRRSDPFFSYSTTTTTTQKNKQPRSGLNSYDAFIVQKKSAICFPYAQQNCSTAMLGYISRGSDRFIVAVLLYTVTSGQSRDCTGRQLWSAVVTALVSLSLRYSDLSLLSIILIKV